MSDGYVGRSWQPLYLVTCMHVLQCAVEVLGADQQHNMG